MFNIDPRQRPTIDEVVYHLENISETKSIKLTQNLKYLIANNRSLSNHNQSSVLNSNFNQTQQNVSSPQGVDPTKWMDNAASIFKTIKQASSKVIDTMQQLVP